MSLKDRNMRVKKDVSSSIILPTLTCGSEVRNWSEAEQSNLNCGDVNGILKM